MPSEGNTCSLFWIMNELKGNLFLGYLYIAWFTWLCFVGFGVVSFLISLLSPSNSCFNVFLISVSSVMWIQRTFLEISGIYYYWGQLDPDLTSAYEVYFYVHE